MRRPLTLPVTVMCGRGKGRTTVESGDENCASPRLGHTELLGMENTVICFVADGLQHLSHRAPDREDRRNLFQDDGLVWTTDSPGLQRPPQGLENEARALVVEPGQRLLDVMAACHAPGEPEHLIECTPSGTGACDCVGLARRAAC